MAIEIVHHIRKPPPGVTGGASTDEARGASALRAATRSARILASMTAAEAKHQGIEDEDRWRYFHAYRDKANLAPLSKRHWYRKATHELKNGDMVGVPVWWQETTVEPDPKAVKDATRLWELATQEGRKFRKSEQAKDWAGKFLAECLGLDTTVTPQKRWVQQCLADWEKNGTIEVFTAPDSARKQREFYRLVRRLDKPEWPDRETPVATLVEVSQRGVANAQECGAPPRHHPLGWRGGASHLDAPDPEREAIMFYDGGIDDQSPL